MLIGMVSRPGSASVRRIMKSGVHVLRSIAEVRDWRKLHGNNKSIGFVPTMGALHDGHLSLVAAAKRDCDEVVASIFVNPTQFAAGEDLDKYPRTFESDMRKLEHAGVEYIFHPTKQDMYPKNSLCHVEPEAFSLISEGQARPQFFRGVATVVCKLFNIVQPTTAFFGQKDISQCILIRRMVEDLNIDTSVRVCRTIREDDGLAMSSRNAYLTKDERKVASVLFNALSAAKSACEDKNSNGLITRQEIIASAAAVLASEQLVTGTEYISVADPVHMKEVDSYSSMNGGGLVISAAIKLGTVRLIDNVLVGKADKYIIG